MYPPIATTPEIDALVAQHAPVAIGVSGGKDSCALALALPPWLDERGHKGPRVLIHSDLGVVEWEDSLPTCERLAEATGLELVVVRRKAGGMMERWEQRWRNNAQRYADLSCVQLILPWSTPSMRFCTGELKTDVITAYLKKRFPGQRILSASGIRRDESTKRKKSPIFKPQKKLLVVSKATAGFDWHPILDWTKEDVFALAAERNFRMHEAYTVYGSSRVSCWACIMSSAADLRAALKNERKHPLYRRMVDLELASTFGFQGDQWLADLAPELLASEAAAAIPKRKEAAEFRQLAEAKIPEHLLYEDGWPTVVPSLQEAQILATVRTLVADAVHLDVSCTKPQEIVDRYKELMALKAVKTKKKKRTGKAGAA